jgi:N6-adenosine-specific RNA methylase IME4
VQDIMRFPLPEFEPDALLLLWRVSSMVEEAYQVVRAWNFVPKAEIIWAKRTKDDKPWFGMGRYVRASHETCIVATRGRFKVAAKNVRSGFAAKVPVGPDGKYLHSAKPPEFYPIIEQLSPGPYVELFARAERPGWESFGHALMEVPRCPRRGAGASGWPPFGRPTRPSP